MSEVITSGADLEGWFGNLPIIAPRMVRAEIYGQKLVCRRWPGAEFVTVASLNETVPKSFNRWWQVSREDDPATCPIKNKPQTVLRRMHVHPGYETQASHTTREKEQTVLEKVRVGGVELQLHPSFYAHEGSNHYLIMPEACWSRATTQILGGPEVIKGIVELAGQTIDEKFGGNGQVSWQVGLWAAQNLVHPHGHVYKDLGGAAVLDEMFMEDIQFIVSPDLHVFDEAGLIVAAGGHRTGGVIIFPSSTPPKFGDATAALLDHLITLYTKKFVSVQGMPVDYAFELCIRNGKVAFGTFYPITGPLGTMEYFAPFMPGSKYWNIGWPEERTKEYLLA